MERQTGEHPRIGAVDVIPFVPLGDTTMDECVALARAFGSRIADRFDLPVYLYARAALRPDREKLADVRRGQYEGLREEIAHDPDRRPDFGPSRMHPRAGAVAVGARPFLIAYNINLASTDLELAKRIARTIRESGGGLPRVQANGFRLEDPDCAQVSMNLLDFDGDPDLAGLGRGRGRSPGGRGRARRVRAHRPRSRSPPSSTSPTTPGPPPEAATDERLAAAAPIPPTPRLLAAPGPRAAARGCPRRIARESPAHRGWPDRGLDGRAAHRRGQRDRRRWPVGSGAGPTQGELAVQEAAPVGGPDSADAPVVATWGERIVAVGPRAEVEAGLEAGGFPMSRFARVDANGGLVTPGLVDPHTHLLFAGSREGELRLRQEGAGYLEILAAGGGILSTVAATRAATAEDLLAHGRRWLDEMLGHGVTTVEAKSGYGLDVPTELRLLEVAYRLGEEGPIEVLPTWLGAHAVPTEARDQADPVETYTRRVIDEQLPAVAAQGIARFADVFCERGVFDPDQSRRILRAAEARGLQLAAPRRRAGAVRRGRAGRRARGAVGGPPGRAVRRRGRRAGRGRRRPGGRSSRSSCRPRPGSS